MRTNRITKQVKAIADAHIAARINDNFDDIKFSGKDELLRLMREGKTFSGVMDEIEDTVCSITSTLMARKMRHTTNTYKTSVYNAFKKLYS